MEGHTGFVSSTASRREHELRYQNRETLALVFGVYPYLSKGFPMGTCSGSL